MSEKKGIFGRLFGSKVEGEVDPDENEVQPEQKDADAGHQTDQVVATVPEAGDVPQEEIAFNIEENTTTQPDCGEQSEIGTDTETVVDEEVDQLEKSSPGFLGRLFGKKPATESETASEALSEVVETETQETAESPLTSEKLETEASQHSIDAESAPSPVLQTETTPDAEPLVSAQQVDSQEAQQEENEPVQVTESSVVPETEVLSDAEDNAEAPPPVEENTKKGFFGRLTDGLSKTSSKLTSGVTAIFAKRKLDDESLEELEDLLITADLGVEMATRISTELSRTRFDKQVSEEEVRAVLAQQIAATLEPLEQPIDFSVGNKPHIILVAGVNGAGKTTTIGKLARKYTSEGKSVMLAAGDTFRAAAIEQLGVWGERVGVPVIAKEVGADAAGLAFDAVKAAIDQQIDILMIDTAGRLQNRKELMDELAKIIRVIRKLDETAPHNSILVLDATVGQNAVSQAEVFTEIAGITGLVMTKLDGTARGGVLVALAEKFKLPIHYVGVGESIEDLQQFNASNFTRALTGVAELTG